ncbi:Uncharacterized protein FKW44_023799, partial [Caligus rogercresseyi]
FLEALCFTFRSASRNRFAPLAPLLRQTSATHPYSLRHAVTDEELFQIYLYISETLLRFGPIITLAILNILIITRFRRIARKRQDLRSGLTPRNR